MWLHPKGGGNFRGVCLGIDQADKLELSACPRHKTDFIMSLNETPGCVN